MAFATEKMAKVTVAGARVHLRPVVDALHRLHLLHVEDFTAADGFFTLGTPFEEGAAISERLLKAKGLEKSLEVPESPVAEVPSLPEAERALDAIEEEVSGLVAERARLRDHAKETQARLEKVRFVAPLGIPMELLSGYRSLKVWVGRFQRDPGADLARLGGNVTFQVAEAPQGIVGAVFAPSTEASRVESVLTAAGYGALEVPAGEGSAEEVVGGLKEDVAKTEKRLAEIGTRIHAARETHGARLRAIAQLLSIESEKATAPVRFATGPNSFVIQGWVPAGRVTELRQSLASATDGRVFVDTRTRPRAAQQHHGGPHGGALGAADAQEHGAHHAKGHHQAAGGAGSASHASAPEGSDEPPVQFANPKAAKPFEMMMDLHSRPKYWELDPTAIVWLTFPLFFGFMIGDLGFGLLIMLVGSWFKRNYLFGIGGPAVGRMLWLAGLYTAVLGTFLYGEFMGMHFVGHGDEITWASVLGLHFAGDHLTLHDLIPLLGGAVGHVQLGYLSKLHDVTTMLGIAVAIGLVQINAGLLIGFANGVKGHGVKHAVLGKLSWIVLQAGIAVVALSKMGMLGLDEGHANVGWGLFGLSVVMLVAGEGPIAIMELPSILSNLLSYTRLTAVAMSKAGLALVFNMAAFEMGLGALGFLLLFLGYVLLLGLGILAGGLHSLRLQFVEFFTKFYEGGGRTYTPFGHPLSGAVSGTAWSRAAPGSPSSAKVAGAAHARAGATPVGESRPWAAAASTGLAATDPSPSRSNPQ